MRAADQSSDYRAGLRERTAPHVALLRKTHENESLEITGLLLRESDPQKLMHPVSLGRYSEGPQWVESGCSGQATRLALLWVGR